MEEEEEWRRLVTKGRALFAYRIERQRKRSRQLGALPKTTGFPSLPRFPISLGVAVALDVP